MQNLRRIALAALTFALLTAAASPSRAQSPQPIYVLDLRANAIRCFPNCAAGYAGRSPARLESDLDTIVFALSVQGLVNRTGARLYLLGYDVDAFWLDRATEAGQPWGWAAGRPRVMLPDLAALISTFGAEIHGSVRWTSAVPAGLNVATTAAGVEGLAIVRQGSSIEAQVTAAMPVMRDLVGLFHSKVDAAVYERTTYLSRTTPGLLAYQLDGWTWHELETGAAVGGPYLFARDYLIAQRGYVFDLSPWGDEAPNDDPGQPVGSDLAQMNAILDAAKASLHGDDITSVWGFYPWPDKYAQGSRLHSNPVQGEWQTAQVLSQHDARVAGGGGQSYGVEMANASFHRWGTFPHHAPRNRAPDPAELTDLGYINQHLANAGFEWSSLDSWNIDTTNRVVYNQPARAAGGNYFVELNVSAAGQSLYQDVAAGVGAGEHWRLRAQLRASGGTGSVRFVLWGLGGGANEPAQATVSVPADGAWHPVEVTLAASSAHSSMRAQVYFDTLGVNYDLDEFRLARTSPSDDSVANLTYVLTHEADYDFGTPIETFPEGVSPYIWRNASRGHVPVAWGFAADVVDYLPGVMAYFYLTRGAGDFFTAPDSGAGYVNPTFMTAHGADLYVRNTRREMGRMGESILSFFLNGNGGPPDPATAIRWNGIGPDGVAANWRQLGNPTRRLINGGPWLELEQNWSFAGIDMATAVANVSTDYDDRYPGVAPGSTPRFLDGRAVYTGPDFAQAMLAGAQAAHPDHDLTGVDPYTFFYLLRRALGGSNAHRASWIDDTIARELLPSSHVRATVTVRNDGWDAWPAGGCQLGVEVATDGFASPFGPAGGAVTLATIAPAVAPGDSATVPVAFDAPAMLGSYTLTYDVTCAGAWLEGAGNIPYRDPLAVVAHVDADAGVATDASGPGMDAAVGEDGGASGPDARLPDGALAHDAGGPAHTPPGCGCRTPSSPANGRAGVLLALGLALGLRRPRATRS